MKFLSKEDLLGSFIPKPYISKVTLESAGYSRPPKISNPHVDPTENSKYGISAAGDLGDEQTAFYGDSDPASLVVSLDLIIKDTVKQIPIFKGEKLDLRDYIDLCIVQCTTAQSTWNLMDMAKRHSNSLYDKIQAIDGLVPVKKSLSDIVNEKLENVASDVISDSNKRMLVKDNGYRVKFEKDGNDNPLPFQPDYLSYCVWTEFNVDKLAAEFELDMDADRLFRGLEFRSKIVVDVVIRGGEVSAVAYIFRNEFGAIWTGAATDEGGGNYWSGRWIEPTGRLAYNTGDFDPRSGPLFQPSRVVHRHDGRWYTGYQHDEELKWGGAQVHVVKELVKKERVKNTRIKDFRTVQKLEKLNLDLSYIENGLVRDVLKTSRMLSTYKKGNTQKYFSDMFLTRDMENNCRFFFAMRKDKILQDISPLGALYQKGLIVNQYCPIKNIKVYRVRTKGSSEVGSEPLRPHKPYSFGIRNPLDFNNQNEYEGSYDFRGGSKPNTHTTTGHEMIIRGALEDPLSVDRAGSSIQKLVPGSIFTQDIQGNTTVDSGVSYFMGVDNSIKDKTDGYYQYKISFEIEDGAPKYLFELYNNTLKSAKKDLEDYFIEASKLGTTRIRNFTDNPHIENENLMGFKEDGEPIQRAPGETRPGNFDVALNRFTRQFIDFAIAGGPKTDGGARAWPENFWAAIVGKYISTLEGIGGVVDQNLSDILTNYILPNTGNLQGIMTLKKLIENLEGILLKGMKGLRPIYSTGEAAGGDSKPHGNPLVQSQITGKHPPREKTIKIEHQFDSTFNANLPDNVGLDIFGLGPINSSDIGFRKIDDDQFQFIVTQETEKIYKSNIAQVNRDVNKGILDYRLDSTSYSYFTPSIVKTAMQEVDLRSFNNVPAAGSVNPNSLLSTYNNIQRDMATSKNISFPLASFMASSYNLIVVPDIEPEVRVMGPGSANLTTPGDDYRASGINQSYLDEMGNHARKVEDSTLIFSELLDHVSLPADPNSVGKIAMRKPKELAMYDHNTENGYWQIFRHVGPGGTISNSEYWWSLPNQIKALFVLANGGADQIDPGRGNYFQDDIISMLNEGLYSTMLQRSKSRYKFEALYTLEYFRGWKNITESLGVDPTNGNNPLTTVPSLMTRDSGRVSETVVLVGGPTVTNWASSWATLDSATYDQVPDGRQLLCRFKEYSNPVVGAEIQGELPLFEQFFILNPRGTGNPIPDTPQAQTTQITMSEDISPYLQTSEFMRESRNTAFDVPTGERTRTDTSTPTDMSGDDVQGNYSDA